MLLVMTGTGSYDFTADTSVIAAGGTVTFSDTSSPGDVAGTTYTWTFGDGTAPETSTTRQISHTYASASGSPFGVTMAIDYPSPYFDPPAVFKASYITVNPGYCKVPSLTGIRFNDANPIWQASYVSPVDGQLHRFSGTVKKAIGAPSGNFIITAQSIAAGSNATAVCTSDVYVGRP